MSDDMLHVMKWHNGEREFSSFSEAEMQRRQDSMRAWGGQPWHRTLGDNMTCTDWRRDSFFRAVLQPTNAVRRLGIESDHVHLNYRQQLEDALPGVKFVDAAAHSVWMRPERRWTSCFSPRARMGIPIYPWIEEASLMGPLRQ